MQHLFRSVRIIGIASYFVFLCLAGPFLAVTEAGDNYTRKYRGVHRNFKPGDKITGDLKFTGPRTSLPKGFGQKWDWKKYKPQTMPKRTVLPKIPQYTPNLRSNVTAPRVSPPKTGSYRPRSTTPNIWNPAGQQNNPFRYVTPPKPTNGSQKPTRQVAPSSNATRPRRTVSSKQSMVQEEVQQPRSDRVIRAPKWIGDEKAVHTVGAPTWNKVSGPISKPMWLDDTTEPAAASFSSSDGSGLSSAPQWLDEEAVASGAPGTEGPVWMDDETVGPGMPEGRSLAADAEGPIWLDEEPEQDLARLGSRDAGLVGDGEDLGRSKILDKTEQVRKKLDDSFSEGTNGLEWLDDGEDTVQSDSIDLTLERRGDKFTDREWRQDTGLVEKASQIQAEKEQAGTETRQGEFSREELEKLSCDELLAQASRSASSQYTTLCYEIMEMKSCFRATDLAGSGPSGSETGKADHDIAASEASETPLEAAVKAALDTLVQDEETDALYRGLGLEPPRSWASDFLNDVARSYGGKTAADAAHVDDVEGIAGMLDGYQSPQKTDPASIGFKMDTHQLQGDTTEGQVDAPEVLDTLQGSTSSYSKVDRISGPSEKNVVTDGGGIMDAVFSSQTDAGLQLGSKAPAHFVGTKWDGKGEPKHGMTNDEGMVWSDDYDDWVGSDIFQTEMQSQADFAEQKEQRQQARDKQWQEYWQENADPPLDEPIYQADKALSATKAKWEILDRLRGKITDSRTGFEFNVDPLQCDLLEKRFENAIQQGASPEDMIGMYKGFIKHHMVNEGLAQSAAAEVEEIDHQFILDRCEDALGAATGVLGPAGVVAEVAAYGYKGYVEGDTSAGLWEAVTMNIPTNSVKYVKDMIDGKSDLTGSSAMGAVFQDLLIGMGTYSTYGDIKAGRTFGEAVSSSAGSSLVDDFSELISGTSQRMKNAEMDFLLARTRGQNKVKMLDEKIARMSVDTGNFKPGTNMSDFVDDYMDDLLSKATNPRTGKLDAKAIISDKNFAEMRDAALNVFQDKHAMQMLNVKTGSVSQIGAKADVIQSFNKILNTVYEASDDIMVDNLKKTYQDVLAKKGIHVDVDDIDVDMVKATNKKPTNPDGSVDIDSVKASFDRDISANISFKDPTTGKMISATSDPVLAKSLQLEVPDHVLKKDLSGAFYEASGSPSLKQFDPDGVSDILWPGSSTAEKFMHLNDQAPTFRLSADAYGHSPEQLQSALTYKDELFLNDMDLGYTFSHKGFEWMENGHKLRTAADAAEKTGNIVRAQALRGHAAGFTEEGVRQMTKQWKNQVGPGVVSVRKTAADMGIKPLPKGPPQQLHEAMEVLDDVGKFKNGEIVTPEIANFKLKMLGFNGAEEVASKSRDYLQSMQHYVSNNPKLKSQLKLKGQANRTLDTVKGNKSAGMDPILEDPIKEVRGMGAGGQ